MAELMNKLYSYEYFGLILMVAIAVLLIAFIVVLLFGSKDKKEREIEATKKLQQIADPNAFKEDSIPASVEITPDMSISNDNPVEINNAVNEEPNNTEVSPVVPPVEATIEPVNPVIADAVVPTPPKEVEIEKREIPEVNIMPDLNAPSNNEEPLLTKEEEKPLVFNEVDINNFISNNNEVKEDVKVDIPEVEIPTITPNLKKEEVKVERTTPVFSSVFVPPVDNTNKEVSDIDIPTKEELDMELPVLKKEEEKETEEVAMPELKDYKLDELSGETYNINK